VESDQGPPRKYYELTPAGRQLFDQLREEFDVLVALVREKRDPQELADEGGKKLAVRRR
jgi:DNA-binding PadR family transcriptional regulator